MFDRAQLNYERRAVELNSTPSSTWLVPILDFFNDTRDVPGVTWEWDPVTKVVIAVARRSHQSGEELLLAGSPCSNVMMWRKYGFTESPSIEPFCSVVLRLDECAELLGAYLPGEKVLELSLQTVQVTPTLKFALESVARHGYSCTEFLRQLCEHFKAAFDSNACMRPARKALKRARAVDQTSSAWYAHLHRSDMELEKSDAMRVKMSEYLCLTASIEVTRMVAGELLPCQCLELSKPLCEEMITFLQSVGQL